MPSANPTPHPLDAAARDFTPISADEAQSFLAHARKDFTSEANELGYVPVQPCDLERLSLTILALLASVRGAEAETRDAERWAFARGVARANTHYMTHGGFMSALDRVAIAAEEYPDPPTKEPDR